MRNDGSQFLLTKAEIDAFVTNASNDECRINLHGVWFDTAVGSVHATNGHTALVCEAPERTLPLGSKGYRQNTVVQVPLEILKQAGKIARKKDVVLVTLDPANRRADIVVRGPYPKTPTSIEAARLSGTERHRVTAHLPDLVSPPINQMLPPIKREPSIGVGIAPHYLASVAKLGKISDRGVCMYVSKPLEPVLLVMEGDDGEAWQMVIMPMRMAELSDEAWSVGTGRGLRVAA